MSQINLTAEDFDQLHEAVQRIFEASARKIQRRFPGLSASFGRTVTQKFPLYSYVTFEDKARADIDPVVVGIDVRVDAGRFQLIADIAGEETGKVHHELPDREMAFGTDVNAVRTEVVNAARQLCDATAAVLERVFQHTKPLRAPA
jgi:hypothetical protein